MWGGAMDDGRLRQLLGAVRDGSTDVDAALRRLRSLPFESLECATLDHHRQVRRGFPEAIFCEGKTAGQVATITARLAEQSDVVLGTRATPAQFEAARAA